MSASDILKSCILERCSFSKALVVCWVGEVIKCNQQDGCISTTFEFRIIIQKLWGSRFIFQRLKPAAV